VLVVVWAGRERALLRASRCDGRASRVCFVSSAVYAFVTCLVEVVGVRAGARLRLFYVCICSLGCVAV
jgi:hypothetical protein